MNTLLLRLKEFYLANTRRSLLIIAVAVILVIFTSWQIAYGLFMGRNDKPVAVNAPNTSQTSEGSSSQSSDAQTPEKTDAKNPTPENKNPDPNSTGNGVTGGETSKSSSTSDYPKGTSSTIPTQGGGNIISLRVSVPQFGTVLTLSGLNYNVYNYMPSSFGSIFNKAPYTMRKIDYPASLASDSISTGVAQLNTAVRSTPGQKIVLAHSQGAQVASHWMRQYANDPTAPSAGELTFILFGNPLRSTGGGYIIGRSEVGNTIGQPTPTNTKWPIVDVARRYDGWADWVQNTNNQWAVDNATAGKKTLHPHYDQVDLYASTSTIWRSGNTTYVLTKEDNLPLWDDNSAYPLSVRTAMRSYIESAYNRPANDPRTVLLPINPSSWESTLTNWGVPY